MEMRNKVHRLFGERASRVSTKEMWEVVGDIHIKMIAYFIRLTPTRSLQCKNDHGDVDFVYILDRNISVKNALANCLDKDILDSHKNGDVYSILYHCEKIGKDVHVDFIHADQKTFLTKLQYFAFNDFSGIFGMLSKKYNFKYGSEGFFKRYRDSRGNWHDILVSYDLTVGMELLGYDQERWQNLKTYDDIVDFMLSSPMFDYRLFVHDSLNQSDKKSMKRPVVEYVVQKLRESRQVATITDADHFFKDTTAHHFYEMQKVMIEENIVQRKLARDRRLTNVPTPTTRS